MALGPRHSLWPAHGFPADSNTLTSHRAVPWREPRMAVVKDYINTDLEARINTQPLAVD